MDDRRFDRLTVALTERLSRRGFGRFGAAALAALGLAPLPEEAAAAKESQPRRRDKRHDRRRDDRRDEEQRSARVKATARKKKPRCKPDCDGKTCGANGCGGSCGTCKSGFVCSSLSKGGTCRCPTGVTCGRACCPAGQKCAGGICCPTARACGATCCPTGERCVNGACCPEPRVCNGACCGTGETCIDDQCCPSSRACGGDICCTEVETCLDEACCPTTNVCHGEECCADEETCLEGGCCATDRVCGESCCTGDENCLGETCCPDERVCGESCCERDQTCLDDGCCPDAKVCDGACCAGNERCVDATCCPEEAVCHNACCGEDETCLGSGENARCCPTADVCNGEACCGEGQTCLRDGCCAADRACNGQACCGDGETCLAGGCCATARVCRGTECCGPNQSCSTQDGCCPAARACGNGAVCCPAGEACVAEGCCPEAQVCRGACCAGTETCLGDRCCAGDRICGTACCADSETCLGSDCCPNDRLCNGTECCGPNRTCLTSGCCLTDRACNGVCCAANETCVDGACCAAPCGAICCGGNQECVGETCCASAKVCGAACCGANETCVAGECVRDGPVGIVCGDCGLCQRCLADSDTGSGECGRNCEPCLARTLCARVQNDPHVLVLVQHLIDRGYRQIEQPVASVLEEAASGAFIASAVSIPFAHPTQSNELGSVVVRTNGANRIKARALVTRDAHLEEVIDIRDSGQGGEPEAVTLQARISYSPDSGDESKVSNATCGVCSSLCNWSMEILNFADTLEKVTGVKDTIATILTSWPKVGKWLVDDKAEIPDIDEIEGSVDALNNMHDVLTGQFAEELADHPAPPGPERCAGCSTDGFCCQPGRRDCPLDNPIEFTTCVDAGKCCENGVEGRCPPGNGSYCADFRSDRINCGGCAGHGGSDCSDLGPDVQCKNRVCEFTRCPVGQILCGGRCHQTCGAGEQFNFSTCQCGAQIPCDTGDVFNTIGRRCADGRCIYPFDCCPEEGAAGGRSNGGCVDPDIPGTGTFCCGSYGGSTPTTPCRELCRGTDCKIICRPVGFCPSCHGEGGLDCCTPW